ncbi:LemA family protein [Kerstersia gyiorum]|uniref:LemA family protein n=1 Tax=Kerstersia gyiorum TaxID=206506 RepID=UPI0039F64FEB
MVPGGQGVEMKRIAVLFSVLLSALLLSGCGYNAIQAADEKVSAAWSEVLNQYQRRADLIPNLVNTVQGYATHERQVLTEVTQARSKVGSMQVTPEMLEDPEQLARFQAAQSQLSSSLSRLLVVAENYPELKADAAFRDLQAQLDGTENRITVARNRYVQAVQDYNVLVRQFPAVMTAKMFGYKTKANFSVENEADISRAPVVNFGTGNAPAAGAAQ